MTDHRPLTTHHPELLLLLDMFDNNTFPHKVLYQMSPKKIWRKIQDTKTRFGLWMHASYKLDAQ
jgi:hypothetical protein